MGKLKAIYGTENSIIMISHNKLGFIDLLTLIISEPLLRNISVVNFLQLLVSKGLKMFWFLNKLLNNTFWLLLFLSFLKKKNLSNNWHRTFPRIRRRIAEDEIYRLAICHKNSKMKLFLPWFMLFLCRKNISKEIYSFCQIYEISCYLFSF